MIPRAFCCSLVAFLEVVHVFGGKQKGLRRSSLLLHALFIYFTFGCDTKEEKAAGEMPWVLESVFTYLLGMI